MPWRERPGVPPPPVSNGNLFHPLMIGITSLMVVFLVLLAVITPWRIPETRRHAMKQAVPVNRNPHRAVPLAVPSGKPDCRPTPVQEKRLCDSVEKRQPSDPEAIREPVSCQARIPAPSHPLQAPISSKPPRVGREGRIEEKELDPSEPPLRGSFKGIGTGEVSLSRGDRRISELYLTFDGSANDANLDSILSILASRGLKVTFFLSGEFLEHYPWRVQQIVEGGHEVGNHLYRHVHLTTYARNHRQNILPGMTRDRFLSLLTRNEELFRRLTGHSMIRAWRAPFGESNSTLEGWAAALGYVHVSWTRDGATGRSMDSLDWVSEPDSRRYQSAGEIADRIMGFDGGRPGGANGAIILMHVGSNRKKDQVCTVVGTILDGMQHKGYRFMPVSHLLERKMAHGGKGAGMRETKESLE